MAHTVYVLGAGTNMSIADSARNVSPPLATDFFQQLHRGYRVEGLKNLHEANKALYDYIERYWKLSFHDLSRTPFDLEACFTLLEQQQAEAKEEQNMSKATSLADGNPAHGAAGELPVPIPCAGIREGRGWQPRSAPVRDAGGAHLARASGRADLQLRHSLGERHCSRFRLSRDVGLPHT
jgi:hypothetical protein